MSNQLKENAGGTSYQVFFLLERLGMPRTSLESHPVNSPDHRVSDNLNEPYLSNESGEESFSRTVNRLTRWIMIHMVFRKNHSIDITRYSSGAVFIHTILM